MTPTINEIIRDATWGNIECFDGPGVYFLICGDKPSGEVVYVGLAVDVYRRLCQHQETKRFDAVYFLPIENRFDREDTELFYIYLLRPALNVKYAPLNPYAKKRLDQAFIGSKPKRLTNFHHLIAEASG